MTPLALFAYRRPQHLARALAALEKCARLDECRVVVFCDGPRTPADAADVEATRATARAWCAAHGAEIVERPGNLGLARSIASGVDRLCAEGGRVIVLEDDLRSGPYALDFLLRALDRYADESRVRQVSAYMLPIEHPSQPDAFFLPQTTTWGWATWARAWAHFEWEPDVSALADPAVAHDFDLGGAYPYTQLLRDRLAGRNQSWGILWWWAVFRARGLVLHPRTALVAVDGFDGSGTHCREGSTLTAALAEPPAAGPLIALPDVLAVDASALARFCAHLAAHRPAVEIALPKTPWWRRPFRAA